MGILENIRQKEFRNKLDCIKSNLFIIDMPINKLNFFIYSIILFIIQIVGVLLYYGLYFTIKSPSSFVILLALFILIFGIPLLYLNFINCVKRMWDITGNYHRGFWITVGMFAVSVFCIFLFPIALLFFYLAMIFMPGKIVTTETNDEQ